MEALNSVILKQIICFNNRLPDRRLIANRCSLRSSDCSEDLIGDLYQQEVNDYVNE